MAGFDCNEFDEFIPDLEPVEVGPIENIGGITTISNFEHKINQKRFREIWREVCGHHNICHMFKNDDGSFVCMACFRMEKIVCAPKYELHYYDKFGIVRRSHYYNKNLVGEMRRGFLPCTIQPSGLALRLPRPVQPFTVGMVKMDNRIVCKSNAKSQLWRVERWTSPLSWLMYYPDRWSTFDAQSFELYFKKWRLIQLTYWFKQCLRRTWFKYCLRRRQLLRQWFNSFRQRQEFLRHMNYRWFSRWQQYQYLKASK